jgi:hypothetical protein
MPIPYPVVSIFAINCQDKSENGNTERAQRPLLLIFDLAKGTVPL